MVGGGGVLYTKYSHLCDCLIIFLFHLCIFLYQYKLKYSDKNTSSAADSMHVKAWEVLPSVAWTQGLNFLESLLRAE